MAELRDVKAREVMPFDVLDEGSVVIRVEWPRGIATVGTMNYVEEPGPNGEPVKRPVFSNVREVKLGGGTWRVMRGAAGNLARPVSSDHNSHES